MHSFNLVHISALLGLLGGTATAVTSKVAIPPGAQIVEKQPLELFCDGPNGPSSSTTTVTRTLTYPPGSASTDGPILINGPVDFSCIGQFPGDLASGHYPCRQCAKTTITSDIAACQTRLPGVDGGIPTLVFVVPHCEACETRATTGPVPYVTQVPATGGDGKGTVIICEGPATTSSAKVSSSSPEHYIPRPKNSKGVGSEPSASSGVNGHGIHIGSNSSAPGGVGSGMPQSGTSHKDADQVAVYFVGFMAMFAGWI